MTRGEYIDRLTAELRQRGLKFTVPSGCDRRVRTYPYGSEEIPITYVGIRDFLVHQPQGHRRIFVEVIGSPEMVSVPLSELQDFLDSEYLSGGLTLEEERAARHPGLLTVLIARAKVPDYARAEFYKRFDLFLDATTMSDEKVAASLEDLLASGEPPSLPR